MNDLRFLSLILSGGFLFLGGIWLGHGMGTFLCITGGCILFIPIIANLIYFIRWLFSSEPSSQEKSK